MKTCPYCAEEVQDAAIVCKHCGRDLATGTDGTPQRTVTSVAPALAGLSQDTEDERGDRKALALLGIGALAGLILGIIALVW